MKKEKKEQEYVKVTFVDLLPSISLAVAAFTLGVNITMLFFKLFIL